MMLRVLTMCGGLIGGVAASQLPEFTQQYKQRLGGAVDALAEVVADFDASAQAEGLTRAAALEQLRGTAFLERRRTDMTRTFARFEQLQSDLAEMETAGPFLRTYRMIGSADTEVAAAAFETFRPAVPVTAAGGLFAGTGFVGGLIAAWAALRLVLWPFRRRRPAGA